MKTGKNLPDVQPANKMNKAAKVKEIASLAVGMSFMLVAMLYVGIMLLDSMSRNDEIFRALCGFSFFLIGCFFVMMTAWLFSALAKYAIKDDVESTNDSVES